jgi:hypothetical protein
LNVPLVVSVLVVCLVIGLICVLVRIVRTRRFAWLVYVAAVVVWVLILLMIVAAVLLALGRQRAIDAFEITVTLAVTFILIELPLIAGLLPYPETVKLFIAAVALLTPGLAALWAGTRMLAEPSEQRAGMSRLATSSLLYYPAVGPGLGGRR